MDHFTIFQDFYRVIAEMTEEEILKGAARSTYKKYKKIMEDRKEKEQKERESLKEKLK